MLEWQVHRCYLPHWTNVSPQFMKDNFMDTADQILRFRSHRDILVRKMVITMIPSLAAYDTQTFSEHFLHKAMAHLLQQLDKPNERSYGMLYDTIEVDCRLTLCSFHLYWSHRGGRWKRHEDIP